MFHHRWISLNLWPTIPTWTPTWARNRLIEDGRSHILNRDFREREASSSSMHGLSVIHGPPPQRKGCRVPWFVRVDGMIILNILQIANPWGKRGRFEGEEVAGESWAKGSPICRCARSTHEVQRIWDQWWLGSKDKVSPLWISSH